MTKNTQENAIKEYQKRIEERKAIAIDRILTLHKIEINDVNRAACERF